MGARGNSGVITSQIFRGMAEGLGGKSRFNGLDLAHALSEGAKTAYGAVAKPVEGTILTVIRESADAAVRPPSATTTSRPSWPRRVDAAEKSVARTPSLLAILREAGRGRFGRAGALPAVPGGAAPPRRRAPAGAAATRAAGAGAKPSTLVAHADEGFGYETMFLLQPTVAARSTSTRSATTSIDRRVGARRGRRGRSRSTSTTSGRTSCGYGLSIGTLSRISIENLDNQARDVRETRAAAFTGTAVADPPPSGGGAADPAGDGRHAPGAAPVDAAALAVLAVAPGDGLAAIFRTSACGRRCVAGQTANPSTGELLEAIQAIDAREVIVLPNNPNVVLAARQVAGLADRPVVVVRHAMPPRDSPPCSRSIRASTRRPTPADDGGRPGDPDARRDRGGPRRDDRRTQGQARPDDRARPGRRPRRAGNDRRRRSSTASRRSTPGLRAAHAVLRRRRRPAEAETMARRIGRAEPASRSRSVTAASRSTGT
jgi:dihydroxyacetone kinase-like predicted kinase